jgi:four helix bundle protein
MDDDRPMPEDDEPWEEGSTYPELSGEAFELKEGPDGRPQFPFDLEERASRFGESIIRFTQKIPRSPGNDRLIGQLVGCGTSIGANYCEADEAVSKKEFAVKIGTCKKEARETKFFLRMTATAVPDLKVEARQLWREARELHLIFARIYRTCKEGGRE